MNTLASVLLWVGLIASILSFLPLYLGLTLSKSVGAWTEKNKKGKTNHEAFDSSKKDEQHTAPLCMLQDQQKATLLLLTSYSLLFSGLTMILINLMISK